MDAQVTLHSGVSAHQLIAGHDKSCHSTFDNKVVAIEDSSPRIGSSEVSQNHSSTDSHTTVQSRSVTLQQDIPEFTELEFDDKVKKFIEFFPSFSFIDKSLVESMCKEYREQMGFYKKLMGEEKDPEVHYRYLLNHVEYSMLYAQTLLQQAKVSGNVAMESLAAKVITKASELEPVFTEGMLLFMTAEMLMFGTPRSTDYRDQINKCLDKAVEMNIGAASWRIACVAMGYQAELGSVPNPVVAIEKFREAFFIEQLVAPSLFSDENMKSYCPDGRGAAIGVSNIDRDLLDVFKNLYGMGFSEIKIYKKCDELAKHKSGYAKGFAMLEFEKYKPASREFLNQISEIDKSSISENEKTYRKHMCYFMAGYSLYCTQDPKDLLKAANYMRKADEGGNLIALKYAAEWYYRLGNYEEARQCYDALSKRFDRKEKCRDEAFGKYKMLALECKVRLLDDSDSEGEEQLPDAEHVKEKKKSGASVSKAKKKKKKRKSVSTAARPERKEPPNPPIAQAESCSDPVSEKMAGLSLAESVRPTHKEVQAGTKESLEGFEVITKRKAKPVTGEAAKVDLPDPWEKLREIKRQIDATEFARAEELLDEALDTFNNSARHVKAMFYEEYVWLYINAFDSTAWINAERRRTDLSLEKVYEQTLQKAVPWADRLISAQLGYDLKSGDNPGKLMDVYEMKKAEAETSPELKKRLQKMSSTVAHLKSAMASRVRNAAGLKSSYQSFYVLADTIWRDRVNRKLGLKYDTSKDRKLETISQEEFECRKWAYSQR